MIWTWVEHLTDTHHFAKVARTWMDIGMFLNIYYTNVHGLEISTICIMTNGKNRVETKVLIANLRFEYRKDGIP